MGRVVPQLGLVSVNPNDISSIPEEVYTYINACVRTGGYLVIHVHTYVGSHYIIMYMYMCTYNSCIIVFTVYGICTCILINFSLSPQLGVWGVPLGLRVKGMVSYVKVSFRVFVE